MTAPDYEKYIQAYSNLSKVKASAVVPSIGAWDESLIDEAPMAPIIIPPTKASDEETSEHCHDCLLPVSPSNKHQAFSLTLSSHMQNYCRENNIKKNSFFNTLISTEFENYLIKIGLYTVGYFDSQIDTLCTPCFFLRRAARKKQWQQGLSLKEKRNRQYKNWYGITFAEYEILYNKQEGICPICNKCFPLLGTRSNILVVDHDHETGKMRGLICAKDNHGLGFFTNSSLLRKAADYLDQF